ncbi:thioredoxin domain-containing protein [Rickettsiales endosymbiont of Stachyamoeba lipophora]|uniref:thioredoxin domain-containing protein n=1 Tax=Rickettsiales endosymbiont of Stachyamoeba lipophora TaxID=2486578 RepID=UPI000F6479D7|nr:thioredoxin domain-containing protein [Rickettsiales endosymbiont of Stachyamoeba lipophora]AZL15743.1 hypothetical protein EF513_04180 [Rickettsiales endosymbiont of Stachyamoeba lipophora]
MNKLIKLLSLIIMLSNLSVADNIQPASKYLGFIDQDIILGNPSSKKYLIVYSSLSCPHCSDFYNKIFPKLKSELIDTNKIAFANRSFISDRVSLAGTMLAMCNGNENYYTMLKVLYSKSDYWVVNPNYLQILEKLANLGGINSERFHKCVNDQALQTRLVDSQKAALNELNISAIPAFIINGKVLVGLLDYKRIKEELNIE